MTKIILVAMTEQRVIGCGNAIPWHLPQELRLFRALTQGHTIVMGRRTFEAIGGPLPDRRNLVVSRTLPPAMPGVEICRNLQEALALGGDAEKLFFIGGRDIYAEALPMADELRISWIIDEYAGDILFPPFSLATWETVEATQYPHFRHVLYRRKQLN
ncbi:MAG: dihydrofolate reductase [Desulfuromonadales bacterium]